MLPAGSKRSFLNSLHARSDSPIVCQGLSGSDVCDADAYGPVPTWSVSGTSCIRIAVYPCILLGYGGPFVRWDVIGSTACC